MREVAVTEGDKVAAYIQFGYDVCGYGVGDLVKAVNDAAEAASTSVPPPPCPAAACMASAGISPRRRRLK
jgi:hypothetical protein